jgi:glutathione S-transferase
VAIEVFWGSGSPFAWRVLLALEAKGLAYQSRLLEFSKGDNQTPAFLALNPRGQVPVLRDGGYAVYESIAILAYLERKYPEPPLFGATPEESGTIWRAVCEATAYLEQPVDAFILPIYRDQLRDPAIDRAVRATLPPIQAELARLEATLTDRACRRHRRLPVHPVAVARRRQARRRHARSWPDAVRDAVPAPRGLGRASRGAAGLRPHLPAPLAVTRAGR